jgi:bleomycin hydrolase
MKKYLALIILSTALLSPLYAKDKIVMMEKTNPHKEELMCCADPTLEDFDHPMELKADIVNVQIPSSVIDFIQPWYQPPVSQGLTGSCWAFSSVSFFESEIFRQTQRQINLSVMYTVYFETLEKSQRYIETKGESNFGRGSQPNATLRVWKKYGVVPESAYTGLVGKEFYDDRALFKEVKGYLNEHKENDSWSMEENLAEVRNILNKHMGPPPEYVAIEGKSMKPQEYLEKVVKLNLDDYIDVLSTQSAPWNEKVEYQVYDNWWHDKNYLNLPIEDFMKVVHQGISNGYTMVIVGDNSEPGFRPEHDIAFIPDFDIPTDAITDEARWLRSENSETTDDHAIHLVGVRVKNDEPVWYLIKDSGTRGQNGKAKGYMYYREDFTKLKMINLLIHKDVVEKVVKGMEN